MARLAWSALSRWYVLPIAVPVLVAVLAEADPQVPWSTFLSHIDRSRGILATIWQVEATVLAFVTAAVLFAFEALATSRPGVPLREYAVRSGLIQYLMLGSSGLISAGVLLILSPGQPPFLAADVALATSFAGIAAFPLLLHGAIRVIDPAWLRSQRLRDVDRSVEAHVQDEALQWAAMVRLTGWVEDRSVELLSLPILERSRAVEVAGETGIVYDIDLGRLAEQLERTESRVLLLSRLGERAAEDATLAGVPSAPRPAWRAVYRLVAAPTETALDDVLAQLREEGAQAIRSESVAAIEDVVRGYIAVWLAWPEAWARYGQRVAGGLLGGLNPWGIGPVDKLQHHTWLLTESARFRGLREHIQELNAITHVVGRRAIQLGATDVLRSVLETARGTLTTLEHDTRGLADLVNNQVVYAHAELVDFGAAPRLDSSDLLIASRLDVAQSVEIVFRSTVEAIKRLAELGDYANASTLDQRYRDALEHWEPKPHEDLASRMVENPERWDAGEQDVEAARAALRLHERKRELDLLRRAQRLSLLAWLLRSESPLSKTPGWLGLATDLFGSLGATEEVSEAVGVSLARDLGLLSRWLIVEQTPGRAHFLDTTGPVLRVFALHLLANAGDLHRLAPREWMTEGTLAGLAAAIEAVRDAPDLTGLLGLHGEDLTERAEQVKALMEEAGEDQRTRELTELANQALDHDRVASFKKAVEQGWRDNRVIPALLEAAGTTSVPVPVDHWGHQRFGFKPVVEPKPFYVTPSCSEQSDTHGGNRGLELARSEASALIRGVFDEGAKVRGKGNAPTRLRHAIDVLREGGYAPSHVFVPFSWRLIRNLDLADGSEAQNTAPELAPHLKGYFDGIPVIAWWDVPEDRVAAVDLAAFVTIEEGTDADGTVIGPTTSVEGVDEQRARKILENSPGFHPDAPEPERILRMRGTVVVHIRRAFRWRVDDTQAARTVWIPKAARD